jgi:hypothetical protein
MFNHTDKKEDYFDRNGKWLYPLAASLMVTVGPLAMSSLQAAPTDGASLFMPAWLISLVAFLGIVMSGIGVSVTDTLSAAIVRCVLSVAAFGVVLNVLLTTETSDLFSYVISMFIAVCFFVMTKKTRK